MLRYADISDLHFIHELLLAEAENDHFDKALLLPAAARGMALELHSVIESRRRINGVIAYALVFEVSRRPLGFVIMSAGPENKGNEIWLAAVANECRGIGIGSQMIREITNQFKGKNLMLMARCAPASEAMFHILIAHGFDHVETGKQGYRMLMFAQ